MHLQTNVLFGHEIIRQLAFLNSGYIVEMRAKAHRRWPRYVENHFTKKVKTRPRDHQKWNQHVRFTPRGSEKRAPTQFEQFEKKSKLDLGTIKNGFSTSDLPPEGPTKERRVILSNLNKIVIRLSFPVIAIVIVIV